MKRTPFRIAAIYWHTTSVGGINTELQYYRHAALQEGDVFDVIRSTNGPECKVELYPKTRRMKGGDTFIDIQGQAGHHPSRVEATLKFLRENYDALFFVSLVPHPNKNYGFEPNFLPIFTQKMPKAASISDGYWHTYAEWGRLAAPHVKVLYTGCNAYGIPLRNEGFPCQTRPRPFYPLSVPTASRSKTLLTIWPSQWKQIKGCLDFLKVLPQIPGQVELYSVGIEYFKQRETELWKRAVGPDHFHPEFSGRGKAEFFGWQDLMKMPDTYARAWFSVNLQGITAKPAKQSLFGNSVSDHRSIYASGSYNNTESEALYYGACPILHEQVLKSDLPKDCLLTVKSAEELPALIGSKTAQKFACDRERVSKARAWVEKYQDPIRLYREMKETLLK